MKKTYIISIFILSVFMTGCYTQLATRDYEREDFGLEEEEGYLNDDGNFDSLYTEVDTIYADTVYLDEDEAIFDNLYADYPVYDQVNYPEIVYVGGGYYRPYWSYWYYPSFYHYYSFYPGCLVPGYYPYPYWYPTFGIGFHYSYYDPYYYNYGWNYGYAASDPNYKYRTNTTHDSRLRDNDGERSGTRTRDRIIGGTGLAGGRISGGGGTSSSMPRTVNVDDQIGKKRGSADISRDVTKEAKRDRSGSSILIASNTNGSRESGRILQDKNEAKKRSITNKTYRSSKTKVITRSKSGSSSSRVTSSRAKVYKPEKRTSSSSSRVSKANNKSTSSNKSYRSKRSTSSGKSYSSPKSSGRSKSYSSPSRGSSRSSFSRPSGSSSSRPSSVSRSSGSSSRSSGTRSSGGRSGGRSRR